jgi:competence protein ComGC
MMIATIIIFSLIMLLTITNKERVSLKKQLLRTTNKQAIKQKLENERQAQRQENERQKEINKLKSQGFTDDLIEQLLSGKTHIDLTQGNKKVNYKIN